MISIIVAMARNRVIGRNNKLIWHLPADLRHFKNTTLGNPVIMGRKTFESMGKALPGRTNIIVTRQKDYTAPGCLVANSLADALEIAPHGEIFIAGGGEIYRQALPLADRMYITVVDHDFEGDTFFPDFPAERWQLSEESVHEADEKNSYSMTFRTYMKK